MKKALLTISIIVTHLICYAQTGTINNAFGTNGKVTISISGYNNHLFQDIQVTSNGDILGLISSGDFSLLTSLLKYNSNGQLTTTFGTAGIASTQFGANKFRIFNDNTIALSANTNGGHNNTTYGGASASYVKYNANGTQTNNFAGFTFELSGRNGVFDIDILPNNEVLMVGYGTDGGIGGNTFTFPATIRLTSIVSSVVRSATPLLGGATTGAYYSSDVDAAGNVYLAANFGFAVGKTIIQKTNSSLAELTSWGTNGSFTITGYTSNMTLVKGLDDGSLLVMLRSGTNVNFAKINSTASGFVTSFGGNNTGITTAFAAQDGPVENLVVLADGSFLIAYTVLSTNHRTVVRKFLPNGTLDNGFATNGILTISLAGNNLYAGNIALSSDGGSLYVGVGVRNSANLVNYAAYIYKVNLKQEQIFSGLPNLAKTYPDWNTITLSGYSVTGTNNPVSFSSSDPNTVSVTGNTLTIVKAGTASITASVTGNATFGNGSKAFTVQVLKATPILSLPSVANITFPGTSVITLSGVSSTNTATGFSYLPNNDAILKIIEVNSATGFVVASIVGTGAAAVVVTQPASDFYTSASGSITFIVSNVAAIVTPPASITGISLAIESGIKLYPNPVQSVLNIEIESSEATVELFNAQGKSMLKFDLDKGSNQISLATFPTGIYYAKIGNESMLYTAKIFKE